MVSDDSRNVYRPYVLPDKYVVQLKEGDLGFQTPKGIIFVKLLEAENVPRMDMLSKSDPYVKCVAWSPLNRPPNIACAGRTCCQIGTLLRLCLTAGCRRPRGCCSSP